MTLNLDALALMPCNPAIGGTGKGHLVREVDALGGEMGMAIDDTFIQSRMLNTGKGPAVHSLRAQADKLQYRLRMRRAVDDQDHLEVRQAEVSRIEVQNGRVVGVTTTTGERVACRAAVICAGVYLKSRIIIGECAWNGGPQGLLAANALTDCLSGLGFAIRRFKTGTPARLDGRTIDFSQMEPQPGDEPVTPFSFLTDASTLKNRALCYLTYTTKKTHEILLANLHRAPMYTGSIHGTGARYCPSIEDKVVRFKDKERHPVFLEPEGLYTTEWYAQGMSTSMPEEVQRAFYRTVPGLENARLVRLAYAIEYDCIDPTALTGALSSREIAGLWFAGQVNGTSGYEEAAAQGVYAGINAALWLSGREPMLLSPRRRLSGRAGGRSGHQGRGRALPHDDLARRIPAGAAAGQRRFPPHRARLQGRSCHARTLRTHAAPPRRTGARPARLSKNGGWTCPCASRTPLLRKSPRKRRKFRRKRGGSWKLRSSTRATSSGRWPTCAASGGWRACPCPQTRTICTWTDCGWRRGKSSTASAPPPSGRHRASPACRRAM